MNPVTPINAGLIPAIDVKSIIQTTRDISKLTNFRAYLPNDLLQERARQVALYLQMTDTTLRESFPILLTALKNADGQGYFSVLDELKAALAGDLSPADREACNDEVVNIKAALANMLEGVSAKFTFRSESVKSQAMSVYKVEIGERVNPSLQLAKDRISRISDDLNKLYLTKATCVEQRDTLVKAQDVIRKTNLADIFQTYLPDGDDLNNLDLATPEKEAIKQAIALVKKALGILSDGIKYIELATARNNLDKEIESLTKSITESNSEFKKAQDALSDVVAVGDIDGLRMVAVNELDLVASIWMGCSSSLAGLKNTDFTQSDLSSLLSRYKMHLEKLSADYNNFMLT
ncbi:alpha-xenorhabdolysin family binary toxin subunit B [Pseudomonas sp. 6D_7.1_Bac1]|uniref:alpha-xenorhabdolysin family binary toxin subunit B n=1 Tax=Pseudomonas sp. 6D_7.1_Bac1 TaxID=2971615 RepID=UPI0021CAA5D3|nr:alpha-xenorhabdolysin family binary toxin subunit B [Pseudomonas sp. 6D_7.1_Bac1]MCU1750258.1 alpha-xenorhabdolysin family binary toxin subunit B [Pseudomonas sp. 6D_7.1_Bac1]